MDNMNGRMSTKDPNTYSVYASKGLASPTMMPKGDGVLKTTEVMIHGTPSSPRSDDVYLNGHRGAHGRVNVVSPQPHAMSPPSPTHSEVEFAGKGA